MASSNLDRSELGLFLAIEVLDEFFSEILKADPSLQQFPIEIDEGGFSLPATIDGLRFFLNHVTNETLLQIEMRIGQGDHQRLVIQLILIPDLQDSTRVLRLTYGGIHRIDIEGPIALEPESVEEMVDSLFQPEGRIGRRIAAIGLDLVSKLIEGLESLYFEEGPKPKRTLWNSDLLLLPAQNANAADALMIVVALPEVSPTTRLSHSPLHARSGLGLMFNRDLLQDQLDRGAAAEEGRTRCGATMEAISFELGTEHIHVEGTVKKGVTRIPFSGPLIPFLYRGTTAMSVDAGGVQAQQPPGLSGFLRFFAIFIGIVLPVVGLFSLGPLGLVGGAVANVWIVPGVWGAAEQLDRAEELIQGGLAGALGTELSQLAHDLHYDGEIETVMVDSTPNQLRLIDGDFFLDALVFVSPVEEQIVKGWFSRKCRRFVFHQLEGGQKFRTAELARLVLNGKISTPGFHAVRHQNGRLFMRANRDDELANNLHEMFKDNAPDEPYPVSTDEDGSGG